MTDMLRINATAQTFRYKTNQKTEWKDLQLVYNPLINSLDGYGTSIVGRKRYPFIVIGEIMPIPGTTKMEIRLTKHHPTLQSFPCIEYKGIFVGKTIHITSYESYGTIQIY